MGLLTGPYSGLPSSKSKMVLLLICMSFDKVLCLRFLKYGKGETRFKFVSDAKVNNTSDLQKSTDAMA